MRAIAIAAAVTATATPSWSSAQTVDPPRAAIGAEVTITRACTSLQPPVMVLGKIEVPGTGTSPKWSFRLPSTVTAGSYTVVFRCPVDPVEETKAGTLEVAAPPARPQAPEAPVPQAGTPSAAAGFPPGTYEQTFRALFLMLALAVVLESSLAVLFNWRPFVETFNARAVRPLIAFVAAFAFVKTFDLDLVAKLVSVISPETPASARTGSQVMTALMLAGGSAAVNNVLVGLGFRQHRTPDTVIAKPPPTQGWLSVAVIQSVAARPVSLFIGAPASAGTTPPLVAIISRDSRRGWRYFLADPGRFPRSGGFAVNAGSVVEVVAQAGAGADLVEKRWGPHTIAGGAIVDIDLTV